MQLPREMYMGGGISSLSYPSYGYADGGITNLPNYMGGGYLDQYGRQRYGFGKFVKSITKPIAKVLDKIVPNEIKPALPFLAAALPFLAPGLGAGIGQFFVGSGNPLLARAIGSGAINLISQASQEGAAERGISPLSLALAAGTGALASPGTPGEMTAADQLRGFKTIGEVGIETGQNLGTLDSLKNLGLEAAAKGSEFLSKGVIGPTTPLTGGQLLTTAKSLIPGQLGAAGELAYNAALDAQEKYAQEMNAMGSLASANVTDRVNYIKRAMQSAGFNESEITDALSRSGFMYGGNVNEDFAQGGLMNLRMNDMPAEMDLRKGGFVPLGKREKADDVPARLSKNEFVFTAKAVRNAGGGDIRKGAKRMYQIMNQLEARN